MRMRRQPTYGRGTALNVPRLSLDWPPPAQLWPPPPLTLVRGLSQSKEKVCN